MEMGYLVPYIIRQTRIHTDDGNGCSRQTVCTLTFHHRNAIAASHRLAFHRATCKAGRGGLAVRAVVVCGWQSIIEKHPSADRCFIGKNASKNFELYSCDVNLENENLRIPGHRICNPVVCPSRQPTRPLETNTTPLAIAEVDRIKDPSARLVEGRAI